jgi:hypothetical protein
MWSEEVDRKFLKFHYKNPRVFDLFCQKAVALMLNGRKFYGAKAIFEVIRYQVNIETRGDEFKINNNYVSGYVRLFEETYPQYKGFFRKRSSIYDL